MSRYHAIELLEIRIAPASVLTFVDVDGDVVKIISSAGDLNAPGVARLDSVGLGEQLELLNLTDASFDGAIISTVVRKVATGDGLVHVGRIDATGRDLTSVSIKGDLGAIFVGDADRTDGSLKLLNVRSIGQCGTVTQGADEEGRSFFNGSVGAIKIQGDLRGWGLVVQGLDGTGNIGSVTIGGSLSGNTAEFGGGISAQGTIGTITIGGDLVGGTGRQSGGIEAFEQIRKITVRGSMYGGLGDYSGSIISNAIGTATIAGNLLGAEGVASGRVIAGSSLGALTIGGSFISAFVGGEPLGANGDVGTVKIGGNVVFPAGFVAFSGRNVVSFSVGGTVSGGVFELRDKLGSFNVRGDFGGYLVAQGHTKSVAIGGSLVGSEDDTGQLVVLGRLSNLTIGGNIMGGGAVETGTVFVAGDLLKATIRGSMIGGTASETGAISVDGGIDSMLLGGDLRGSSIQGSNSLSANGVIFAAHINALTIGGSVMAGTDNSSGNLELSGAIRTIDHIGTLTIKRHVLGTATENGSTPVIISSRGQASVSPDATTDFAINTVKIGGRVEHTLILAGFGRNEFVTGGTNRAASIGSVTVGGDWLASSIAAGVRDVLGDGFGNADDARMLIPGPEPLVARIGSIIIKGIVSGNPAPGLHTGFTAAVIGSFKAGGITAPLTSGNDFILLSPTTGNVALRELGA